MTYGSIAGDVSLYALLTQFLPAYWLDWFLFLSLLVLIVAAVLAIRLAHAEHPDISGGKAASRHE